MFHDLWSRVLELFGSSDADDESPCFTIISSDGNRIKAKKMDINFVGAGNETIQASGFLDAYGNATTLHGSISFSSSDESIATIVAGADGLTATITGTGKIGTAVITATDSKDNATSVANVTTTAGEAVSFQLNEVLAQSPAPPAPPSA